MAPGPALRLPVAVAGLGKRALEWAPQRANNLAILALSAAAAARLPVE